MPRVDKILLQRKLKLLQEDLARLKNYREVTLDDYLKDDNTQLLVERLLERITGRLIDINYHVLREEYEVMPEDYYNSFIEMGKTKAVTEELAAEMSKAAGLRNALAHDYEKLDQKQIFSAIKNIFNNVPKYIQELIKFLD